MKSRHILVVVLAVAAIVTGACARRQSAPVTTPQPAPPVTESDAVPQAPPAPRGPQAIVDDQPTSSPLVDDELSGRTLEDLNRDSPLRPAFFAVDGFELDEEGRAVVAANAEVLKQNAHWAVTIEGHCDERGTAEYNLALGERRAAAARTYLVSLGIAPSRVKTASYGDEYPFEHAHSEDAWSKNRRAHFVVSGK